MSEIRTLAPRVFASIEAVAPVTHAEDHTAVLEDEVYVFADLAVARPTAEPRAGGDHPACMPCQCRRGQKVLKGGAGLGNRLFTDQLGQLKVGAHIGNV